MKFKFEYQMEIYKDLIKEAEKYEQNYRWEQALNIYLKAEKIIKKYGSKFEKGNIFYRIGKVLAQKGNLRYALSALKESLKFFKKGEETALQIANVKGAIGEAYKINGNIIEALNAYQDSLKILRDEKERVLYTHSHLTNQILEEIAKQLNNIGEIYLISGDWDKALKNCRESLKVALDTKTPSIILKSRLAISKIYSEKGDNKTALEYLLKSLDIVKKEKDKNNLLNIFLEIANIYKFIENSKSALNYYVKALKLSEKYENKQKMTEILEKIGIIYLEKNNKKKALEFFQKSYEIGNEIKQYYFDYILYHLGTIHYLNKNYDIAYENLRESLKFAEKTNNEQIIINDLIKIGDIWKRKINFKDAIYYYKRALEYTRNLEDQIEILNKIGISNLLSDNLQDANDYLLKSFNWLRILLMAESNSDIKTQILENFFDIPQNLCAIKCALYEKTKNIEFLKKAIGYSEFLSSQKIPNNLKQNFKRTKSLERKRIQISEKCLEIKKLNNNYQLEKNTKLKVELFNQIEENQNIIFQLDENIWEMRKGVIGSFPQSVENIINKFFKIAKHTSDSSVLLDFIYIKNLNKLYNFLIDMKKREIYLFSKQFNERLANSIQNKLKQLEMPKIKENEMKYEKIIVSLNNLWNKLVPKSLTNFLIEQNYTFLTIIPHSFLWKLPWETMLIKKQRLNELFKFQRIFSLYYEILK